MSRRFSSLFIVFMVVAPLAIAVDQGPTQPVPAAETGVKPECVEAAKVNVACGKCGDGRCVPQCGETATSCPVDCGGGGEPKAASSDTKPRE